MTAQSLSIVLQARPKTHILPGQTFQERAQPIPLPQDLDEGDILVEVLYLSLDPAMRVWLNDNFTYIAPVGIGEVMRGEAVCRVLASKSSRASIGDVVVGYAGWREHAVLKEGSFEIASPDTKNEDPLHQLTTYGLCPLTAWVGMMEIAKPKPGDVVLVSGAAGATGNIAGQIAKLHGATVIGICGSDEKCERLTSDLGFSAALNYKASDFQAQFAEATKGGIDVYFDNVGGEILDMALSVAKLHARFVECGFISQYNSAEPKYIKNLDKIISRRISMRGFIVYDFKEEFDDARRDLRKWTTSGQLSVPCHVVKGGLRNAEKGLVDLFNGVNVGKTALQVKL